ncbi:MAG TPA: hypothetical protein VK473_02950, partial [Terriglobales bacterium]|nr:hypothetical protein [Terriglobales bacterium]
MATPHTLAPSDKQSAACAFARSLNILLKHVKLYGSNHRRSTAQFDSTWAELRTALGTSEAGFLLGVAGGKLLLDGVPLESGPAERSFAHLLSTAGISSIHFSRKT